MIGLPLADSVRDIEFYLFDELPSECPVCHRTIIPKPLRVREKMDELLDVYVQCPLLGCQNVFVSRYERGPDSYRLRGSAQNLRHL
jgi:hypothetical protein